MSPRSFRLKIALLSVLVSGGLLAIAGVALWQLTYRFELARVDRELRNLGAPQLERVVGSDHWIRFEGALGYVAGARGPRGYLVRVQHGHRLVHQSAHWPREIDPDSLPEPTDYETGGGPQPAGPPPPPPRRGEEISPRNPALPRKVAQFVTRQAGDRTWRLGVMGNPYMTVVIGVDLADLEAGLADLRRTSLLSLPVALLFAGLGAWFLASRALRPVLLLTETAERVTARGLDQRLPAMVQDREFNRLVTVFNEMLDRLEKSFHQANRFSADAAHELKTPLTILQGELEHALQAAAGTEEQHMLGRMLEEIGRLRAITEKLLLLSRADAGALTLLPEPVDLSTMVGEAVEDLRVLGPDLTVEADIPPGISVRADPHLLPQLIQNLTTNAVRHNEPRGRVVLTLARDAGRLVLRVGNTGPGIPAGERDRLFARFHRSDSARSRARGGVGLGLSLAREIARAHGGELSLEPEQASWTWFRLELPAGQEPPSALPVSSPTACTPHPTAASPGVGRPED